MCLLLITLSCVIECYVFTFPPSLPSSLPLHLPPPTAPHSPTRPAKEQDLAKIGTVLLLITCDEDSNATLGISVIHGLEIPHLYAHVWSLAQGDVPERRKMTLNVFMQKESSVLKEIEARLEANDPEVVDFCKLNKRVFEHCQFRKHTLTKWLSH